MPNPATVLTICEWRRGGMVWWCMIFEGLDLQMVRMHCAHFKGHCRSQNLNLGTPVGHFGTLGIHFCEPGSPRDPERNAEAAQAAKKRLSALRPFRAHFRTKVAKTCFPACFFQWPVPNTDVWKKMSRHGRPGIPRMWRKHSVSDAMSPCWDKSTILEGFRGHFGSGHLRTSKVGSEKHTKKVGERGNQGITGNPWGIQELGFEGGGPLKTTESWRLKAGGWRLEALSWGGGEAGGLEASKQKPAGGTGHTSSA